MSETKPLISTIRSVIVAVASLDDSRQVYENAFGLKCLGETDEISDGLRNFWNLGDGNVRFAQFGKPGEKFGVLELIELSDNNRKPVRKAERPFDYGLLSLNFKTIDIEKALGHLDQFDIKLISDILTYEAGGKKISEAMAVLPSGERVTILQVGEKQDSQTLFGEPVATVGTIIGSLEATKHFYCDVLGLSVAVEISHTGLPFTKLLGIDSNSTMDMAMLTSAGNWTGKFEFIELTVPPEKLINANLKADLKHLGYQMISVLADDLEKIVESCNAATNVSVSILVQPRALKHPFLGETRGMLIETADKNRLEIFESKTLV